MLDARKILALPAVYRLFTVLIGAKKGRERFVREFVRPKTGDSVLDIGCGPADILGSLPDVQYSGFDASPEYIEAARQNWGSRGTFTCATVNETTLRERNYDLVLAVGLVHHLDDAEARALFKTAYDALKPGGRLITLDGVYVDNQPWIKRYLISKDRGQHIRRLTEYERLAASSFSAITPNVVRDLMTIPYTHAILECVRS